MKSTNQGFVELHSPTGFFAIGAAFLILTAIIVGGALICKRIAARERVEREKLRASLESPQA